METPSGGSGTRRIPKPDREEPGLTFGRNRDKIRVLGDIVSPMPAEWFEDPTNSG